METNKGVDTTREDEKRREFLKRHVTLIEIRGCQWKAKKTTIQSWSFSKFWGKTYTLDELVQFIKNESFFGLVKVDLFTPEDAKSRWKALNIAPLITRQKLQECSVSPMMIELIKARNIKFPLNGIVYIDTVYLK